jgi:hypothetical protein
VCHSYNTSRARWRGSGEHMSLFSKFSDEAAFRESFVRPLLNRLGYYGVAEQHGTQEFGKDFVFSELHRLGGMRHYAAQVKHEQKIVQGKGVDALLSQVRQAFAKPFKRPDSPRDCHVSAVYVFNSGEITDNAREQLLADLERERYGDNVHFLDGERLSALNEWATVVTEANARARLNGLRLALRFIDQTLDEYQKEGKADALPLFIQGIELFLSEPVNIDESLLVAMFAVWQQLKRVDEIRRLMWQYNTNKAFQERNAPKLMRSAGNAKKHISGLSAHVEIALNKMKPL